MSAIRKTRRTAAITTEAEAQGRIGNRGNAVDWKHGNMQKNVTPNSWAKRCCRTKASDSRNRRAQADQHSEDQARTAGRQRRLSKKTNPVKN